MTVYSAGRHFFGATRVRVVDGSFDIVRFGICQSTRSERMSEFGFMISTADVRSLISPSTCHGGVGRCLGGLWGHFGGGPTETAELHAGTTNQCEELILRTLLLVRLHGGDIWLRQ